MSIPLLVGSILGVLVLAALASWMGLGGGALGEPEMARRTAEEALPGFEAGEAFVSDDGRAAIVLGRDEGVALVKLHGTQPATRRLERPLAIAPEPDGVRVESGERMFGAVALRLAPEERDRLLTLL